MPLALLAIWAIGSALPSGCARPVSTPQGSLVTPLPPFSTNNPIDLEVRPVGLSLSYPGLLLALSQWGYTSLAVLDSGGRFSPLVEPRAIADVQLAPQGRAIAYRVLEGINSAHNYIEVVHPDKGKLWRLKSSPGFALVGFALDTLGGRVAYTEINVTEGSSRQARWQVMLADLETAQARPIPTGSGLGGVPIPFAFSGDEVYIRSSQPFRGLGGQGVWILRIRNSEWKEFLPENRFTGQPRLSPDGRYLAYLVPNMEALPKGYIPSLGLPPGNWLMVRELSTGQEIPLAFQEGGAFGTLAWSSNGSKLLASRLEWQEDRFGEVDIAAVDLTDSTPRRLVATLEPITQVFSWGESLYWVSRTGRGEQLMGQKGSGPPATLLALSPGQLQIVGYLAQTGRP